MGTLVSLLWVNVFYNLFLLLGVTLAVSTDAVNNYRLAVSFILFYFFERSIFFSFCASEKKENHS